MSANTSQRKARATILASDVEAFRTWFLVADCGQCGPRARRYRTSTLLFAQVDSKVAYGSNATVPVCIRDSLSYGPREATVDRQLCAAFACISRARHSKLSPVRARLPEIAIERLSSNKGGHCLGVY